MIVEYVVALGAWSWIVLGLLLLIVELLAPGIFFIWFGLAALVTALVTYLLTDRIFLSWQAQILIFLVLSVVAVLIGRRYFGTQSRQDEPLLNLRGQQLVGQRATLDEPIVNGRGRLRINDTVWRIKGPDLPSGAAVEILAFDPVSLELEVRG